MNFLLYRFGLDSIVRAYRASIAALETERAGIEADWQTHLEAVAAGEAKTVVEDETSGAYYDYGEHTGELLHEIDEAIRHIREAFATLLYHYWEKKAAALLPSKKYEQTAAFSAAKVAGWSPDEVMLNRLRLVANCIKHDSTASATLNAEDVSYFDQNETQYGWYEALRLSQAHLEAFINAVRDAGPPTKKWLGKPQEVTL